MRLTGQLTSFRYFLISPRTDSIYVFHTFVAGQPFRLRQIRNALAYILNHPRFSDVWVTTPGAIANYAMRLPEGTIP
jgi:hypothetical protein